MLPRSEFTHGDSIISLVSLSLSPQGRAVVISHLPADIKDVMGKVHTSLAGKVSIPLPTHTSLAGKVSIPLPTADGYSRRLLYLSPSLPFMVQSAVDVMTE